MRSWWTGGRCTRAWLDSKAELIRALIPLGLMHIQELLDNEVMLLAGARHARDAGAPGVRYGSNPGSGLKTIGSLRSSAEQAQLPIVRPMVCEGKVRWAEGRTRAAQNSGEVRKVHVDLSARPQ